MTIEIIEDSYISQPLVSVAVVTYNQKIFLKECIESILDQDYPNIEIVVADDGSTDGTVEMLADYAAEGRGRFVLNLSEKNNGVTKNQQLALSACTGEYISWMAGDDYMLPGKIKKQVAYLENHPECSICYHDLDIFESSTGMTIKKFSEVNKPREGGLIMLLKYGAFNGAVSNMVRRSASPINGFDQRILVASDWLYWVECLWSGGQIGYVNEVLARHRRHENNVTSSSVRKPSLSETQDFLFSCEKIITQRPEFYKEINNLKAYSFQSLRWLEDGNRYGKYLRASLSCNFKLRVFLAYILFSVFGIKIK